MTTQPASQPASPPRILPELKLPLGAWLTASPLTCVVVGGLGYAVCLALGADQPLGAVWGGLAAAIGMLIGALAILPWIPRPINQWANLLLGGQLFSFMAVIGSGFVVWKATGTGAVPLGMTGAAAFLASQLVQVSVFQAAARPIERRLLEEARERAN